MRAGPVSACAGPRHPDIDGGIDGMNKGRVRMCGAVSQSVDLGRSNNPNTTPTKDYENVRVVVYLRSVQRGCAEEGERGSTPTG